MHPINELLKNKTIEWKKLREVCEIKTGKLNAKEKMKNGKYPFFTTSKKISNIDTYAFDGESLLIAGNANIGDVKYFNGKFNAYQRIYVLQKFKHINILFLMHYMKMELKKYLFRKKKQATMSYIVLHDIENFLIPIPSLETQEKIVKILDKFTSYITALQAELQKEYQARKKQYEYYRSLLFSKKYLHKISKKIDELENNKKLKEFSLEHIIKIKHGKDWKQLGTGIVPVYGSGGKMNLYVDQYLYNKPTVLIPRKGSIENVFYLEKPFWNIDTIFYTEINENKILPKYFYYFIENYNIKSLSTNFTRPTLTKDILKKIRIKLPHKKIQDKVVKILDTFQALINDISEGLLKEIELRQKQYEYYREKLLHFPKELRNK
ncbi:MAG TPA: restriction endonuclease subunit S [Planctomycetota bacterium]|nr:restriction endonuclease subunit S [Planctomycetota bacterium]